MAFESALVGCRNTHGDQVDKFQAFGLTAAKAAMVDVPLIAECHANLECKVVKAWVDTSVKDPRTMHHQGHGVFMVAGERIKLASKMK